MIFFPTNNWLKCFLFFFVGSIDVSNWERHLSPSFGTPSLDHFDGPPSLSFGTLNAVATYCLRILSKSTDATLQLERTRLSLVLEQSLSLLLSQALLYILDPRLSPQVSDWCRERIILFFTAQLIPALPIFYFLPRFLNCSNWIFILAGKANDETGTGCWIGIVCWKHTSTRSERVTLSRWNQSSSVCLKRTKFPQTCRPYCSAHFQIVLLRTVTFFSCSMSLYCLIFKIL